MRISDWSSDVCSSDLSDTVDASLEERAGLGSGRLWIKRTGRQLYRAFHLPSGVALASSPSATAPIGPASVPSDGCLIMSSSAEAFRRSEEHTSELQSLMRISYAVFCLKKKINYNQRY